MKIMKLALLFLLTLLLACGGKSTSQQNETTVQRDSQQLVADTQDEAEQQSAGDVKRYRFQCLLNNKYPVDLTFEEHTGIIQGQIVYTKTEKKTPIRLLGEIENDDNGEKTFSMQEVSKDGSVTGFIKGKITSRNKFEGTWTAPDKYTEKKEGNIYSFDYKEGKSYTVRTVETPGADISLHSDKAFVWNGATKNPYGTYEYSFGEYGQNGEMEIYLKEGKMMCKIMANTAAPAFHMANVEEQECVQEGDYLLCTLPTEKACQFKIQLFEDFAVVNYVDEQWHCEFGMGATVEGIYLKTK